MPLHVFAVDHNSWLSIKQLLIVLCESHTAAISRHCSLFKLLVCFGEWVYTFPLYVFCFHVTACSYLNSFHSQFNSQKPSSVLCFVPYSKDSVKVIFNLYSDTMAMETYFAFRLYLKKFKRTEKGAG